MVHIHASFNRVHATGDGLSAAAPPSRSGRGRVFFHGRAGRQYIEEALGPARWNFRQNQRAPSTKMSRGE